MRNLKIDKIHLAKLKILLNLKIEVIGHRLLEDTPKNSFAFVCPDFENEQPVHKR